jgi:hypothetical protein
MPEIKIFQGTALPFKIAVQRLMKRAGSMKVRDAPRQIQRMPDVMEPSDFAVRGIEKGYAVVTKTSVRPVQPSRVSLGLRENILRADRELLCLDDSDG